ncbi:hypothetical protein BOX15_Mlig003375g1, partial [Macrostomum lignano]
VLSDKSIGPGKWSDYTCVLPSVSVGNVGQLAADLIISSGRLYSVGYWHSASLTPVCGPGPFGGPPCTAAELWESEQRRIVVLQLRSPVLACRRRRFLDEACSLIAECGFARVLLLASAWDSSRREPSCPSLGLAGSPGWPNPAPEGLEFEPLEPERRLSGVGLAGPLFRRLAADSRPTGTALACLFCSEGDNSGHAGQLAEAAAAILGQPGLAPVPGRPLPSSWRLLYGSRPVEGLY